MSRSSGPTMLRRFLKKGRAAISRRPQAAFGYGLGVLAAGVTIVEANRELGLATVVVVGVMTTIAIVLVLRRPPDISGGLPTSAEMGRPYRIEIPANIDSVKQVIDACQPIFGGDAIDPDADLRYFKADPYSIVVLKDVKEELVGFIDFYFFGDEAFDQFLDGTKTFSELLECDLLPHPDARQAPVVYVATHVNFDFYAKERAAFWRQTENAVLIWGASMLLLHSHRFPDSGLRIYSVAWSDEGAGVLDHMLFQDGGEKLVVKRGPGAGKRIYSRTNVTRRDVRLSVKRFDERAMQLCDLVIDGETLTADRVMAVADAPRSQLTPAVAIQR